MNDLRSALNVIQQGLASAEGYLAHLETCKAQLQTILGEYGGSLTESPAGDLGISLPSTLTQGQREAAVARLASVLNGDKEEKPVLTTLRPVNRAYGEVNRVSSELVAHLAQQGISVAEGDILRLKLDGTGELGVQSNNGTFTPVTLGQLPRKIVARVRTVAFQHHITSL